MGAGRGAAGSPQGPRPEPSAGAKVAGGTRRAPPPAPARGEPSGARSCWHGRAAARAAGGEWDAAGAEVSPPLAAAAPSSASSPPAARCGCPCGRCEERDRPAAPRTPRGKDGPEIPDEAELFSCIGAGRCGSRSTAENLGAAPRPPVPAAQMGQAGGGGTEHLRPNPSPHSGPGASQPRPCGAWCSSAQGRDPAVVWWLPTGSPFGNGPGKAHLWVRLCWYRDYFEENRGTV